MIGSVVVFYNPTIDEICNINTYIDQVDFAVIVDNSDIDNRERVFEILFENERKIEYFSRCKNFGLCKGLNIGIDILSKYGCKYAFILDQDSKIDENIFRVYTQAIRDNKKKQVAVFAPIHIFDRGRKTTYVGYKNITWAMTSGWLVDISIFELQHGFFEPLFVDGLDMDYCLRSHANNYEIIECGEAKIYHNPAETKKFLGIQYGISSPVRYNMQARQLIWCWKKYNMHGAIMVYLYKWLKVMLLFPNKVDYIKNMIKGTKEGLMLYSKYK